MAVIATPGSTAAAIAAKAATTTIPIIFSGGGNPVQAGLVASLNRPGGNVTGISSMNVELGAKRLGLLHELVPSAARFFVLINPKNPFAEAFVTDVRTAAMGRQIEVVSASTNLDIDTAFAILVQKRADALLVSPDPLFVSRRVQLATLAARHAVPAIYPFREDVEAGGLMSYGASNTDLIRQAGVYTGRVLKGEKPADLPVMQATKFEFVINLQTARALGVAVPPMLLARADVAKLFCQTERARLIQDSGVNAALPAVSAAARTQASRHRARPNISRRDQAKDQGKSAPKQIAEQTR